MPWNRDLLQNNKLTQLPPVADTRGKEKEKDAGQGASLSREARAVLAELQSGTYNLLNSCR